MISCCREAGFQDEQFLVEEGALPDVDKSCISVATDDVPHFQRGSQQEVAELSTSPLASFDDVWSERCQ